MLSRLPVKSVVRFKCLARFWFNIINSPPFAIVPQPFRKSKPGLLITCPTKLQLSQTTFAADQNSGAATCCLTVSPRFSRYTTQSINGIVCMDFGICATVCNPSIRQAVTQPFLCHKNSPSANSTHFYVNFIGCGPKNKQYKVLNSWGEYNKLRTEYRVYTLGGTNKWRVVHGGPPCRAQRESICINGIVFFRGWMSTDGRAALISFNVETEAFQVMNLTIGAPSDREKSCLIEAAGRLAAVDYQLDSDGYCFWMLADYGDMDTP